MDTEVPQWFIDTVKTYTPDRDGCYLAQLLWQRGIQDPDKLPGFLDPDCYQPTSANDFGQEIKLATERLKKARIASEKVTIWGDFDADGITSTSVLWEGLGQFFPQQEQLNYYIPNRLTESHGLNHAGIERLAASGTTLIVTCDTGSTNIDEIEYVDRLGIDIIITDHHTLPAERPPAIAIINPRYFAQTHPLYHLSGVAVAYKLVEAMYEKLPNIPQQPLENLLDLVAIGLIADLVELRGDCRYLAQLGIRQLQKQADSETATRPGIYYLLKSCHRSGDRPTDISFGLGPRINAVSRIHGDASFCVELLTSRDRQRCEQLAIDTELANTRRKSLQKQTVERVKKKLESIDLSTTSLIVLEDSQWQGGVLGLVAGQIAQEYGRPTILLSTGNDNLEAGEEIVTKPNLFARGSARSVNNIDLYELVKSQQHLLDRFGGHPYAAGLSLPVENITIFRDNLDRQLKQQVDINTIKPSISFDLVVDVSELNRDLFKELKMIEPCGMGNPTPKLLIRNCWFTQVKSNNIKDLRGQKIQYLQTSFLIWDRSVDRGFPGLWWEHTKEELPESESFDSIVELDFNTYQKCCQVRLIALEKEQNRANDFESKYLEQLILDWRGKNLDTETFLSLKNAQKAVKFLKKCPINWNTIQQEYRQAITNHKLLALAYPSPDCQEPEQIWQALIGIAKYLSRTGQNTSPNQLKEKLQLSDRTLNLGLQALSNLGFQCQQLDQTWKFMHSSAISIDSKSTLSLFLEAIEEEQFQRQYFYQIPLDTLQKQIVQSNNL